MSTQIPPIASAGASLGLSSDEIETTVELSADLSDAEIALLGHVADLHTSEERRALTTPTAAPVDESDLLTLEEVADMIYMPADQVSALVESGELPTPLNVPGVGVRWYGPAISAWLDAADDGPVPAGTSKAKAAEDAEFSTLLSYIEVHYEPNAGIHSCPPDAVAKALRMIWDRLSR